MTDASTTDIPVPTESASFPILPDTQPELSEYIQVINKDIAWFARHKKLTSVTRFEFAQYAELRNAHKQKIIIAELKCIIRENTKINEATLKICSEYIPAQCKHDRVHKIPIGLDVYIDWQEKDKIVVNENNSSSDEETDGSKLDCSTM